MLLVSGLFKKSRWLIGLALLIGVLSGISNAGLVAVTVMAVRADHPIDYAWYFAGLCLLMVAARVASSLILVRLGQSTVFELRLYLTQRILSAPFARLQELGMPRLMANLTEDIAAVAEAFAWFPLLSINGAIVIGCLIYLGWLSWLLLGIIVGFLCLGILSFRTLKYLAMRKLETARNLEDDLHGHFRGLTEGIKELKLHEGRRRAFLEDALRGTAEANRRYYVSGMTTYILVANWGNSLFYIAIGLVLFVLPLWYEIPLDTQAGYSFAILYMMAPLALILEGLPTLDKARIAIGKISTITNGLAPSLLADTAPPHYSESSGKSLELVGVTHRYHGECGGENFLLGPIDLTLHPGELVFIIGGNGSGKTTLALLLVGLYSPEQGEIRLAGKPMGHADLEYYRQHFSAVFSDFYLFDSLLGFQDGEIDEKARLYLAQLQLDKKVEVRNGIFSTTDLSRGQRKRLALLVTYLEERPFYLFDEWAADQDPVFKRIFYEEILPALKARGKTVVVITHDDGYFHMADRCLKLSDGRISELSAMEKTLVAA